MFMTDGHPTTRAEDSESILRRVTTNWETLFIGFSTDHNFNLLYEMTKQSKSSYYFIDSIEQAGMVYGEILATLLYRYVFNVTIQTNDVNTTIYDPNNNTLVNTLHIPYLSSEDKRSLHVLCDWNHSPSNITITYHDDIENENVT